MNLTETRAYIATQLSTLVDDLNIYPIQPSNTKVGDGWLKVTSVAPSTFQTCQAGFDVLVMLGTDPEAGEEGMDTYGVALVDALSASAATPLTVQPSAFNIDGTELHGLAASFIIEIEG